MLKVLQFKLIFLTRGTNPNVTDGGGVYLYYESLPDISTIFKKKFKKIFQKNFSFQKFGHIKNFMYFCTEFHSQLQGVEF